MTVAVQHTFLIKPSFGRSTQKRDACIDDFLRILRKKMGNGDTAEALSEFIRITVKSCKDIVVKVGKTAIKVVVTTAMAAQEFAQELQLFLHSRVYNRVQVAVRR